MNYYIADMHLGHENIMRHSNRPFSSVEKMDEYLLKSGFEIVGRYKNFRMFPIEDRTYKVFYVAKKR